jgi:hypothetical protein
MGALLRTLARTGFRRGLSGPDGRGWLTVGIAAALIQFLRRKSGEPKVCVSEKLKPGETMIVTHLRESQAR